MTFRTTLFQALTGADVAHCNGRRVMATLLDDTTPIPPFVDLDDGTTLRIEDAEIAVDADGRAYTEQAGHAKAIVWRFLALQPITVSSVQAIQPHAPRVGAVITRLRQIEAQDRRQYG